MMLMMMCGRARCSDVTFLLKQLPDPDEKEKGKKKPVDEV
jgi:hypothetical protein